MVIDGTSKDRLVVWLSDSLITCYEAMVVFLEVPIYRQMSIVYQFLCMKLQTRGNHSLPVIQEE